MDLYVQRSSARAPESVDVRVYLCKRKILTCGDFMDVKAQSSENTVAAVRVVNKVWTSCVCSLLVILLTA